MQHRLFDVMLNDEEFDRVECRQKINVCRKKEQWEQVERLLKDYEKLAPKNDLHKQYVMEKQAELMFQTGQDAGQQFKEALELTMAVKELERRLNGNGIIAEDELWMYFRYRSCERAFSEEEYENFLNMIEQSFLVKQIYPEVYYEAAYQYALHMYQKAEYVRGREVCGKMISWLKKGKKSFCLPQILFLDAIMGMRVAYYRASKVIKMRRNALGHSREEYGGKHQTRDFADNKSGFDVL